MINKGKTVATDGCSHSAIGGAIGVFMRSEGGVAVFNRQIDSRCQRPLHSAAKVDAGV